MIYGALLPHPPVLVPEVGGTRLEEVAATQAGVRALCQELAEMNPSRLVLMTPHGPYLKEAVALLAEPSLEGSLERFRAPQVALSQRIDLAGVAAVQAACEQEGLATVRLDAAAARARRLNLELDHGLLVPLYYLREAGLDLPAVVLNVSGMSVRDHFRLGRCLGRALGEGTAMVASGDLSHRLLESGPYGFDEMGPIFDRTVVEALRDRPQVEQLLSLPGELVRRAGVCGYQPLATLLGAMPDNVRSRVFSYEGPLGVGYAAVGMRA